MLKNTSLKLQSALVTSFLAILIILTLVLVFINIASRDFKKIETNQANRNISRTKEVYELILHGYTKKIVDWGSWDDTYKFVDNLNSEYIVSNLGTSSLEALEIDKIIYFNKNDEYIYGVSATDQPIPVDIQNILKNNPTLILSLKNNLGPSSGIIKTGSGLSLYTAHLVLKSDGSGPANGSIMFFRDIGPWFTASMTQTLKTPITFADSKSSIKEGVIVFESDVLRSNFNLPVFGSDKPLTLTIEMNREIWNQVTKTTRSVALIVATFLLIGIFMNYLFFNMTVVKDLIDLKAEVGKITSTGGEGKVSNSGLSIETNKLREDINILIDLVYKSKVNAENRVKDLDRVNNLMTDREVRMAELKNIIKDLKNKII